MKLLLELIQEDIDAGAPCEGQLCPLALATNRALGERKAEVHVEAEFINLFNLDGEDWSFALPLAARLWVSDFDAGREVWPFTLETTFEKGTQEL